MKSQDTTAEADKKQEVKSNVPATKQPTQSQRFTNAVMAEFSNTVTDVSLTNFQRKLCQSYFIKLDTTIKEGEKKRMAKSEEYRDALPVSWENINMPKLAIDTVCWSAIGLDPMQPNHINMILYKNSSTKKFDVGFIPGYKGTEIKAKKYGLDVPDDVIVELVFSTDKFKQFKKDSNNKVENYTFEVTEDFNRGEVVGGFYYHIYNEKPEKNKIRVFSKADIEKRKPDSASVEFWGGSKDEWKNGQKTGNQIKVEGWFEEMAWKTIYKAAYSSITIDSSKIDDNYLNVIKREAELTENKVAIEVLNSANKENLSFDNIEDANEVEVVDELVEAVQDDRMSISESDALHDARFNHDSSAIENHTAQTSNQPSF